MDPEKHKALVSTEFGKKPQLLQVDVPKPKNGQILIKMQGTTINPSDRLMLAGKHGVVQLPKTAGLQGSGRVIKAEGQDVQHWVGKRVSFISQGSGTWGGYCATIPSLAFEIDDDVSLQSASSGVVNPLTVLGMIEICRERKLKGIIHTAAASSLGRMLNKVCLKEKVPLLNLVRRQEHAEILKKEGAENVLITTGDWQDKFKEYVEKDGFDCFFDALGGGEITTFLMENMKIPSGIFIYGALTGEPLVLNRVGKLHYGLKIEGYLVGIWWFSAPEEVKKRIRENYSAYLKNDLATKTVKELTFNEYDEALELSINNTLEGKVLLKPL